MHYVVLQHTALLYVYVATHKRTNGFLLLFIIVVIIIMSRDGHDGSDVVILLRVFLSYSAGFTL